jgi:hypothetical protein
MIGSLSSAESLQNGPLRQVSAAPLSPDLDPAGLPRQFDTPRADQDTPGSMDHNGSHASSAHPLRCLRVELIEPQGSAEPRFLDNHTVPGWGTRPGRPFDIRAAGVPTAVPGFRPSCLIVIMADASATSMTCADVVVEKCF